MSLFSAQSTATEECKPTIPATQVISVVAGLLKPLAHNLRDSSTLAFYDIDTALVASATFPDNEVISIQDSDYSVQNDLLYVFGCPTGQVQRPDEHGFGHADAPELMAHLQAASCAGGRRPAFAKAVEGMGSHLGQF